MHVHVCPLTSTLDVQLSNFFFSSPLSWAVSWQAGRRAVWQAAWQARAGLPQIALLTGGKNEKKKRKVLVDSKSFSLPAAASDTKRKVRVFLDLFPPGRTHYWALLVDLDMPRPNPDARVSYKLF